MVSYVNNVIQLQVDKYANLNKVCVLRRIVLTLEYRAVCVDKHP